MSFVEALYIIVGFLFPFGWAMGCLYFCLREDKLSKSSLFRISNQLFIGSWILSWILMFVLLSTLPIFHWITVLLYLPLLFISAFSLWLLVRRLRYKPTNKKSERKTIALFWTNLVIFILLMILQFLFRYTA